MTQPSSDCASRLKLLSDPTRLRVMRRLLETPCHVGDLQTHLDIEQSLLSHHLRVLRDAGLVRSPTSRSAPSSRPSSNSLCRATSTIW